VGRQSGRGERACSEHIASRGKLGRSLEASYSESTTLGTASALATLTAGVDARRSAVPSSGGFPADTLVFTTRIALSKSGSEVSTRADVAVDAIDADAELERAA
jgi:hypothetical protein